MYTVPAGSLPHIIFALGLLLFDEADGDELITSMPDLLAAAAAAISSGAEA
jgi:hypothetical protein